MSDKHYVGLDVTGFRNNGQTLPVSRVTLLVDDENVITAGDDTGLELSADCPHATQEMADAILAAVRGLRYRMYGADAANIDPAAELGDGVDVGGIYSVVARMDDDGSGYAGISAPGEEELEDEYPASGPMTQAFSRKIAETRSYITKTAEEIRLAVENEVQGLSASLSVKLDGITSQVTGLDSAVSSIEQKVDNISLSVSNGTDRSTISLFVGGVEVSSKTIRFTGDVVFESDLADGSTTVSGDCITTGEISARYIKLGGEMEVYETLNSNSSGGYLGYMEGLSAEGFTTQGIGLKDDTEAAQVICTNRGARLTFIPTTSLGGEASVVCTRQKVTLFAEDIVADGTLQSGSGTVITSDRKAKKHISYKRVDQYLEVFDRLRPCVFRLKGRNRRHLGFIAQEVESAMQAAGIDSADFAALVIDAEGGYGLRYEEFIPLLVAKVQQLEKKVEGVTA